MDNNTVKQKESTVINEKKKDKSSKKSIIIMAAIIIGFILICFIISGISKLIPQQKEEKKKTEEKEEKKKKRKQKESKKEKTHKEYNPNENYMFENIYFYEDEGSYSFALEKEDIPEDKVIEQTYQCTTKRCFTSIGSQQFNYPFLSDGRTAMFSDGEKYIHFDVKKGVLGYYSRDVVWLLEKHTNRMNQGIYFFAKKYDGEKYGIVKKDGEIIKDFTLDKPDTYTPDGMLRTAYSIEDNLLVANMGNKYGLTKISGNEVIVGYEYDAMRIINSSYIKVKKDGKWHLLQVKDNKYVMDEGFDEIIPVNGSILITKTGDYLSIKDFKGRNLTDQTIKDVSKKYNEYVCCAMSAGISTRVENDILTITIDKQNDKEEKIGEEKYEFNIKTHELTKK